MMEIWSFKPLITTEAQLYSKIICPSRWIGFSIEATGTSFTQGGVTIHGLVSAREESNRAGLTGGDSGGPFVIAHGSGGNYQAVGLLTTGNGGPVVQYTPMQWIPSGFTVN